MNLFYEQLTNQNFLVLHKIKIEIDYNWECNLTLGYFGSMKKVIPPLLKFKLIRQNISRATILNKNLMENYGLLDTFLNRHILSYNWFTDLRHEWSWHQQKQPVHSLCNLFSSFLPALPTSYIITQIYTRQGFNCRLTYVPLTF